MILTEEEYRQKWCPHVREIQDESGTFNRGPEDSPVREWNRCIASDCSQWRWADEENRENFYAWAEAASRSDREDAREVGQPIQRGYCGLAGKP